MTCRYLVRPDGAGKPEESTVGSGMTRPCSTLPADGRAVPPYGPEPWRLRHVLAWLGVMVLGFIESYLLLAFLAW